MGPNSVGEDLSKAMLEIIALTGLVIAWLGMLSVWYFLHHLRVPTAQHMGSVSLILALTGGCLNSNRCCWHCRVNISRRGA